MGLLSKTGRSQQSVQFPNLSRSYDATRCAVRFWGYDRSMEVSFFVMADALQRLQPGTAIDETGLLRAFDSHRDAIMKAAARIYAGTSKGSYDLVTADF